MVKSDKNTLTPKQVGNKLMLLLNEVSKKHPNSLWHWDSLVLCWDMICFVYENSIPLFSDIFLQLIRSFEAEMTEVLFFRVQNNKELTEEMRSFTKFDPENPKSDLNKSRDLKKYDTDEIKWGIPYYNWISLSKQAKVELLAGMAREDTNLSYHVWHNNFKLEFPEGYSVEMGRYKKKFRRSNRGEQFAINGLAFYKKNR